MNGLSCTDVRELAAEMALDALDGDERARVLAHIDDCRGCRQAVEELSRAADALLTVVPAADVPPALSASLHGSVPRRADTAPPAGRASRSGWRRPLLGAAAVLVLVAIGVVGLAIGSADAPHGGRGEFPLADPGGATIGEVVIRDGDPPWIWMGVDGGEGTATLTCVVVLDDGSRVTVGPLSISDGKGSWGGPLDPAPERIVSAQLVDSQGNVVAAAPIE